jgi:hypothetical protein
VNEIVRAFHEGGQGMWVLLLLGMGTIPAAIAYAMIGEPRLRVVVGALLGVILLAGMGFRWRGRQNTEAAVVAIDPEMRARILEQGYLESSRPMTFAIGLVVAGLVPFGIGELRRRRPSSSIT